MADVTRTVFGIYYPESRRVVDELWSEKPHTWYERNYTGYQDSMHRGFLERWRAWAGESGVQLGGGYTSEYPTAGANEGIHALLALHAARRGRRIHVFAGEYEGYSFLAAALGIEVVAHRRDPSTWEESLGAAQPGDQFWISQPSAIDGNLWDGFAAFADWMAARAPEVQLIADLTYVGAVAMETPIDLRGANVAAVLWSLSKPFGVYYHRIGGLLARAEVPTLRGHLWFKNLFSVHLGERLMAAHPARDLPSRYKDRQRQALEQTRAAGLVAAEARPSDVVMLASVPGPLPAAAAREHGGHARGDGLRFCLSPLMDRMINP